MTVKMNLKWTEGNSKLVKSSGESYRIVGFGIPADFNFDGGNTCPGASSCRGVCYAKQGRYVMAGVKNARMHNLHAFLTLTVAGFVSAVNEDLKRLSRRFNVVRIHDSGDFFSQNYLNAWKEIARANPSVIFYAYTKSHHLDIADNLPNNLRIIQSLGGKYDRKVNLSLPHARIFASDADRVKAGYVDGNVNDIPAIEGVRNIGLVYHGVRKLTDAQKSFFA